MSIQPILKTITINDEIKEYCKINIPIILDFFKVSNVINTDNLEDYVDIYLLSNNLYINKLIQNISIPNIKKLVSIIDDHKAIVEQLINIKNDAITMRELYQNYDAVLLQWEGLSKEDKSSYNTKEEYVHGVLLLKEQTNEKNNLAFIKKYQNLLKYYSTLSEDSLNIDISDYINKNYKLIHTYIPPYKKNIILINKEIVDTIIYPIVLKILNSYSVKYTEKDLREIKEYLSKTYCVIDGFSNLELLLNDKQNNNLTNIIYNLFSMEGMHFSEIISLTEGYSSSYTPYNKLSVLLQMLYVDETSYSYYIKFYASLNNISNNNNMSYGSYIYSIFSSIYKESKDMVNTILNTPYFMVFLSIMIVLYHLNNKGKIRTDKNRIARIAKNDSLLKEAESEREKLIQILSKNPNNIEIQKKVSKIDKVISDLKIQINYQQIKRNGDHEQHQSYKAENKDLNLNDSSKQEKQINKIAKNFHNLLEEDNKNDKRRNRQKDNDDYIGKINTMLGTNINVDKKDRDTLLKLKKNLEKKNLYQQNKIDGVGNNFIKRCFGKLNDSSKEIETINKLYKKIIG